VVFQPTMMPSLRGNAPPWRINGNVTNSNGLLERRKPFPGMHNDGSIKSKDAMRGHLKRSTLPMGVHGDDSTLE
jgi:hypothetical protein